MIVGLDAIRLQEHVQVGDLIRRESDVIIERWRQRVLADHPKAKRMHHATLLNDLPELLEELGRGLAESDESDARPQCRPARDHGEQRWETGWSLAEVVQDYQLLRMVLLEHLQEVLQRPLRVREVIAIGVALDDAIAASVNRYIRSRDDELHRQTDAMKEADRRKDEFLAMLAHELRNPLSSISNAAQIIRREGASGPNHDWSMDVIVGQVKQITRMVDDLLDVSRLARGKVNLIKEVIELAPVIEQAIATNRSLLDERGHQLRVALSAEPMFVEADATRLVQVLSNLVTNAAKYTEDGGVIEITAAPNGAEAVVCVRDNGIGIPPEVLPRVFELFMQGEQAVDRAHGGLGIGLTLVRHLVTMHGGAVAARSQGANRGSEFEIRLPLAPPPPTTASVSDAAAPAGTSVAPRRRLLVVDDNDASVETLSILLRAAGHEVHTATDGHAALLSAETHRPEIILLDIGLPGMDGYEVARRIRELPALAQVVLVAVSGYGKEEDKLRAQAAGFNAHLVKPADLSALQAILENPEKLAPR